MFPYLRLKFSFSYPTPNLTYLNLSYCKTNSKSKLKSILVSPQIFLPRVS